MGQFHGVSPDPAGRARDEQALPRSQRQQAQGLRRGQRVQGQHRGVDVVE
ncbi:hypothetical protein ACIPVK_13320 [Paeniglutamicibacter sp. MACA_103]